MVGPTCLCFFPSRPIELTLTLQARLVEQSHSSLRSSYSPAFARTSTEGKVPNAEMDFKRHLLVPGNR